MIRIFTHDDDVPLEIKLKTEPSGGVIAERLHVVGCITTARTKVHQQVLPIFLGWIALGVVLLILDLLALLICLTKLVSPDTSRDNTTKAGGEEIPLRYTSSVSLTLSKNRL